MWFWSKDRYINDWNRIESSYMPTQIWPIDFFFKGKKRKKKKKTNPVKWRKKSSLSTNDVGIIGHPYANKMNFDLHFVPYIRIN